MANNSGRARGRPFKPKEPYTQRLRKILEEYPDGSQILREILQNSDDAKSSQQIFILDHNTYSSNKLFEPELVNGYNRTNLKLDRYQGPALLALNNTIFEERDFQSLLKLADSEKRDQFDKIGVMGVGFNSIYHITDSPSFITGDKFVILDPHEWYFGGGVQFDFVEDNLQQRYPDQFAPFVIPSINLSYNDSYDGTIFRYPLRTKQDSIDSDISKKVYSPNEILETFYNFYKNERTNCILFLKYIETITFFELKEGAAEPDFLFTIELTNANEVREQRRLIAENIVPMMNSLTSKQSNKEVVTSYVASFRRQRGISEIPDENSSWLILNYLDDLQETESHFKNKFKKNIADYKFIPNVGLAINLNDLNAVGRLFCFLPLPISTPFSVSVNGYFAVSTNRRSLWTVADNEDLAADAIARLKVSWNQYLFENVLPKAWVRFLRELPYKFPKIKSGDMYKFWPIFTDDKGSISNFCKDLLKNVIENLDVEDHVFEGPSLPNVVGTVSKVSASSYDASLFEGSKFYWLSLSNGFLDGSYNDVSNIIKKIGFPVISTPLTHDKIIGALKESKLKDSFTLLSPINVRNYLKNNIDRWQDKMLRPEVLRVFKYVFTNKNFNLLEGFKIIPLANNTLGTLTKSSDSYIYIGPNDNSHINKYDEINVFKDHLNKFIDKNIDNGLYKSFYSMTAHEWNLNIKVLDAWDVINMIKFSLKSENVDSEEIKISNHREWIHKLWGNLSYRRWDLKHFENVHLIPTSHNTLRKLKTPKKVFLNHSTSYLNTIFEKFGAVFVESIFEKVAELPEVSPYIIKPDDMILVLKSFQADTSYPNNLNHLLQIHESKALLDHLSNYFRFNYKNKRSKFEEVIEVIEVIKHLPIFTEVDHTSTISLLPDLPENGTNWFLLPKYEENLYGRIICPSDKGRFLNSNSQNLRYILEDIIKIPRLNSDDYWQNYVIPYLESQQQTVRDVVIDKLFDHDNLKPSLKNISFVPVGTFEMSKNLQLPINVRFVKPTDLFDPEEKALVDLFFENEQSFPTGQYGISTELLSKKFLSNLRSLGMKSILSSTDVVSRINTIMARKLDSTVHVDSVRIHALKLFKYMDDNWNKLTENDDIGFLNTILENEWIPTVDKSGNKIFSKPQDCYCQRDKNLVCFIAPIFEQNAKNEEFSKLLKWKTYPEAKMVLKQLESCYDCTSNERPSNLKEVCFAIYEYMNKMYRAGDGVFELLKESLENIPWILCGKTFYCADQIVFKLPHQSKLDSNDFSVVEFPAEYPSKLVSFFKAMGVRDVIGVKDLILIIKDKSMGNLDRELSTNEIKEIIQILEQIATIQQNARKERKYSEKLDGLLVPSTKNKLVNIDEIQYDDMKDRIDEKKKSKYQIIHHLITPEVVKELGIETLTEKIYGNRSSDINWDIYEQDESLTTRIKNIIKDYPLEKLFIEFLQNADDAKAKRFSVIIDERPKLQHDSSKTTLLSDEMDDWQGPSIWIYNDAEFSDHDFMALIKLGVGGKSHDNTKIGRFGIGFNSSFHVTDLPSIVSGKYIAFLDPNAKFLPAKKYRGTRFNFIEMEFNKRIPDQCFPYKALEDCGFIKDCSFTKEFKGTLFRLPLRTHKLAEMSEISNRVIEIKDILKIFENVQGSKEMLFLRNIESCSLYHIDKGGQAPQMKWQAQIDNMSESIRDIRKSVIVQEQTYQLEIERTNEDNRKSSEIWLLCNGEQERVKPEFEQFSSEKRLRPRGGVAALIAKSDEKCLDELKAESLSNPPALDGEMFSYLPLSVGTNLGVHLNGNFSLSSARSNILHDFLEADSDDARWNRYILCEILPDLHAKLIDHVVIKLIEAKLNREQTNVRPHHLWPIRDEITGLYKDYGLNVIKRLGISEQKFLWTEANNGQFISLQSAKILKEDVPPIVADILAKIGVLVVTLDKKQFEQLEEAKDSNLQYTTLDGKLVCEELQKTKQSIVQLIINELHRDTLFQLLKFILQDEGSYKFLAGLCLVPLSNGSVGKFGQGHYVGEKSHVDLFPKIGPSKFIINLSDDMSKAFCSKEFSEATQIKKFDASAILDLLKHEIPSKETAWNPKGDLVPNKLWLEKIWSLLTKEAGSIEFDKLSKLPLLPMTKPSNKLVNPNPSNPLLHDNGHILIPILVKLKVRFTDMKVFENDKKLKQCILECNPINIINSLKKTCSSLSLDMKGLFGTSELTPSEYEKFRTFILSEQRGLIDHGLTQNDFIRILSSLPIWSIQNCEDKFIDARSGILLPSDLPFFTFNKNTDFYKCNLKDDEYLALVSLNAKVITELQYVKDYLLPNFEINSKPKDCEGYIPLLKKLLSLKNLEIEQLLKNRKVIPNQSLSAFVSANELYDKNVPIFLSIFEDSDKFLPVELLQDSIHLERLVRIGLKRQINYNTFIECTQEIILQISNNTGSVRDRAKVLVRYLYEHIDNLRFNNEQWDNILEIKFVPSEVNLPRQLYQMLKETSGFESFNTLRLHKYKKVCWTQCPLFDENLEPTTSFNKRHPEIGIPSPVDIMEHWFVVVDRIELWNTLCSYKEINEVIKEIYNEMNELSQIEKHKSSIQAKINNDKRKLFLNKEEDPFDPKNWVLGKDLVFDLEDDFREVSKWLKPYKHLLLLGGAQEVKGLEKSNVVTEHKQDKILINALLKKVTDNSGNEPYDVFFIVGKEKERIGAFRLLLSAASTYFEKMFCGSFSESAEKEIEIPMVDESIQPEVFRVFLRWLYGQPLDQATKSVLRKKDHFTKEQESYESYYLDSLVHLLKVADVYGVETLKDEIVPTITDECLRVWNVLEIKEWAINCNASQLIESCEKYIVLNEKLVLEQNKEDFAIAEDEN